MEFLRTPDDRFADLWREIAQGHRQRTFGVVQAADVSSPAGAYSIVWGDAGFQAHFPVRCEQGEIDVRLRLTGEHNRMNALAAIAGSLALGAGLEDAGQALAGLAPVAGRLCPLPGVNGARLIDDSYNANPDSVMAALRVLAAAPGRRTLVLGDLAELGTDAPQLHRQLGERAAALGIDRLFTVGELSGHAAQGFSGESRHFSDREALSEMLLHDLSAEDSVLVKGSRSARMDEVVNRLHRAEVAC